MRQISDKTNVGDARTSLVIMYAAAMVYGGQQRWW
jgi:hypothetical protein